MIQNLCGLSELGGRKNMRILITAGGTREYIDPVRFISNASTGKMGYALARAALKRGHKVTLITTRARMLDAGYSARIPRLRGDRLAPAEAEDRESRIKFVKVETAAEMFQAVKKHFPRCDCLIMAAAVADYTPVRKSKVKIKKAKKNLIIKLKPTSDILKWAGRHKRAQRHKGTKAQRQIVVGFALEDKNLQVNAQRKLKDKNLDMIIVNTPAAIGADKATVHIKTPQRNWLKLAEASKTKVAQRIISLVEKASS